MDGQCVSATLILRYSISFHKFCKPKQTIGGSKTNCLDCAFAMRMATSAAFSVHMLFHFPRCKLKGEHCALNVAGAALTR